MGEPCEAFFSNGRLGESMVHCNECTYWNKSTWKNGICRRVDEPTIEYEQQEFHMENDGQLEESSYLVTGRDFGCILGEYV